LACGLIIGLGIAGLEALISVFPGSKPLPSICRKIERSIEVFTIVVIVMFGYYRNLRSTS